MNKNSVFLADWQVLFREGVHFALSGEEDIDVIGEAADSAAALDFIEANSPDVVVLHIDSCKGSGIEVATRIRHSTLGVAAVLILDSEDEEQLFSALKSGASACLTNGADPDDLVDTVRKVAQGIRPISEVLLRSGIASRVIDEFEALSGIGEPLSKLMVRLTPEEVELLHQIAGRSSGEPVSQALDISEPAVRQQLDVIRAKLVANEHTREVIESVKNGSVSMIPGARLTRNPGSEYVTRNEFAAFKKTLREYLKCLRFIQQRG